VLEYGCHVRDVFRIFDGRLMAMLQEDDPLFENWDQDETAVADRYDEQDPGTVADELAAAGAALADRFDHVGPNDWARPGRRTDGSSFSVDSLSRYLLHDIVHHLHDVAPLVPADFVVPARAVSTLFVLEPLGPEHNASDLAAWTSSIDHIRATPGFAGRSWPERVLSLEENETDLVGHAEEFRQRTAFTYTVLDPASGDVTGCVYLYPSRRAGYDVAVMSWVTADRADLDKPLYEFVREWLAGAWPFSQPDYAER
jgi:hypothetical protein